MLNLINFLDTIDTTQELCDSLRPVLRLVGYVLLIIKIAVPIILIVVGGIVLTVLFIKKDLKASIVCPIIYLVFLTSVYLLTNHYFSDVIYNVYMLYYSKIVLVGFIFLIFYTCLSFSKKDKVLKKTK